MALENTPSTAKMQQTYSYERFILPIPITLRLRICPEGSKYSSSITREAYGSISGVCSCLNIFETEGHKELSRGQGSGKFRMQYLSSTES